MPANPSFGKGGSPGRVADDPPRHKHTDKVARGGVRKGGSMATLPRTNTQTDKQTDGRGFPADPPFSTRPGIEKCYSATLGLI